MEPITIVMLCLAAGILILSCVLQKKDPEATEPTEEILAKLARRELTEEEIRRLSEQVDRIISEKTEEVILKTDDYLSKVANEKIMAVDEFSRQIMERLGKDNSDATFLYKMIAEAKEELKSEIEEARKEKLSLSQLLQDKEEKQTEDTLTVTAEQASGTKRLRQGKGEQESETARKRKLTVSANENEKRLKTRVAAQKTAEPELAAAAEETGMEATSESMEREYRKKRILELSQRGCSVREISRELSMGQGEVKLFLELYGNQKG